MKKITFDTNIGRDLVISSAGELKKFYYESLNQSLEYDELKILMAIAENSDLIFNTIPGGLYEFSAFEILASEIIAANTAREQFKRLGFFKILDTKDDAVYQSDIMPFVRVKIIFNNKKFMIFEEIGHNTFHHSVGHELLRAINKQFKELGWL